MAVFTDQMGRGLEIPHVPKRIVSLVPSQTELLADLGLEQEVVGITKFCIHPAKWFKQKKRIGGTKTLHLEAIRALQPDLILGNKEENDQEQIQELAQEFPVWMSDIYTLTDATNMMLAIGEICGRSQQAGQLVDRLQKAFEQLDKQVKNCPAPRTAYFIWRKPYMVAGSNTFIHHMLERGGLENIFSSSEHHRYPEVHISDLNKLAPEVILLSSEPYPFGEKHIKAFKEQCPKAHIQLVDGELFSWYGSRLLQTPDFLLDLQKAIQAHIARP
ncbi:MAG: helical backbone metal receptor [Saprospiraceae bacterium]